MNAFDINQDIITQYARDGYYHARNVLGKDALNSFTPELRKKMNELNPNKAPMEARSTYKSAFTQVTNLWKHSKIIRDFVFTEELARLAAEIMGVRGVRLYHDQALFKEAGGGVTPWHVDQVYWPVDTANTCTFWIPMQTTPRAMGTLSFARGSHLMTEGREMVISDESEAFFSNWVKASGLDVSNDEFELGDISIHAGWTVHHAGPNQTRQHREVMTIIYMADDARLLENPTQTQLVDRDAFAPGIQPGQLIETELNPLLFKE